MGVWERLPDAPFAGADGLERLSDGRLLAWGSSRTQFGDGEDPGDAGLEVAIYDPGARAWQAVERPAGLSGSFEERTLVAGDRLLQLVRDDHGVFSGMVYDTRTGAWSDVPALPDVKVVLGQVAWNGETLVVVRTEPGEVGRVGVGTGPYDVNDPEDGTVEMDYRVDAPLTRRWTFGSATWADGAPPPLSARIATGAGFDGEHLAIVGGTTGEAGTGNESLTRRDGAVYDVAADTWTPLPAVGWPAVHISVGWIDGGLVVAGGGRSLEGMDPGSRRSARLSEDGSAWVALPDAPVDGVAVNGPTSLRRAGPHGDASIVRSDPVQFDPARPGGDALIDGGWESTPTQTYDDWDGLVVSTADRLGNGGNRSFAVRVRRGVDDWVATAEAPFTARMMPGAAIVGDRSTWSAG